MVWHAIVYEMWYTANDCWGLLRLSSATQKQEEVRTRIIRTTDPCCCCCDTMIQQTQTQAETTITVSITEVHHNPNRGIELWIGYIHTLCGLEEGFCVVVFAFIFIEIEVCVETDTNTIYLQDSMIVFLGCYHYNTIDIKLMLLSVYEPYTGTALVQSVDRK